MPSFTGKSLSTWYKNILGINQAGNTGVDSTTRAVQDGAGNSSALSLSDDVALIQPVNDDTTSTFEVKNNAGSRILRTDTTNSIVRVGAAQVAATTGYVNFGTDFTASSSFVADIHYAVSFGSNNVVAYLLNFGSSTSSSFNDTNPSATITIINSAFAHAHAYWYIFDDITIDSVIWFHGADTATGDTTAAHLMTYEIDTDNGSTSGDLSNGTVVADGSTITNAGSEQVYYQSMTIQSADVDAGNVVVFTFGSDTINADYSVNAQVKYHIR